jgi:hypothetical protein
MSCMLNSWVERRAAKERYLRNAADVWRRAQAAIAEACDRLREHYSEVASVRRIKKNDDTVVITIARSRRSALVEYETVDVISIQFKPDAAGIAVKRGRSATLEFPIGADADDAFITWDGRELLLDEFSRLALEQAFRSPEGARYRTERKLPKLLQMAKKNA